MRRTFPLLLAVLLAAPAVRAEDEEEEEAPKAKKKAKGDSAERDFEGVELTPKRKKKKNVEAPGKSDPTEKTAKGTADDKERPEIAKDDEEEEEAPKQGFPRHRYGYVLGGGFFVAGLAFAYSAQGEGKRAETIGTAREASIALDNARASAATANVIYGVAVVTLAVTLIFELLPRRVAERASLTFHF